MFGAEQTFLYVSQIWRTTRDIRMGVRVAGYVTKLNSSKGFGFIKSDVDGKEFFFHRSGCKFAFESCREGHAVTFDVNAHSPKGPRAENVEYQTQD